MKKFGKILLFGLATITALPCGVACGKKEKKEIIEAAITEYNCFFDCEIQYTDENECPSGNIPLK